MEIDLFDDTDYLFNHINIEKTKVYLIIYQVYLNGNWIRDCNSYEEAETIANGNAMNGSVNIEKIKTCR
jgi:hypothetical protein